MKDRLRRLLKDGLIDDVVATAAGKRRVLGSLVSMTFDADPLLAWRAVEALGAAAERVAGDSPEFVRNILRRLHWLLSEESGGVCWRAPEAMAEIVRRRPELFGDYASIVVTLIDEMAEEDLDRFRPGILWATGRLAGCAAAEIKEILPSIIACLDKPDPQTRGMAAWCLGQVGRADLLRGRDGLLSDDGPVELYEDGQLTRRSVAEVAIASSR